MGDLLETVIEAHGGLERWNKLNTVSARLIQGGVLWPFKGQEGVLDDVVVTAACTKSACRTVPSARPTSLAEPLFVSIDLSEIEFT